MSRGVTVVSRVCFRNALLMSRGSRDDVLVMSPVMSRSCLGLVSVVVSWSCLGVVSVMSRCCFGDVSVMSRVVSRSCLCLFLVMSRCCFVAFLVVFWDLSVMCW